MKVAEQKSFRFHAKRGQHGTVCRLLTERFGKPKCTVTDEGVMITLSLPPGVSKRTVDRAIHAAGIPGASSRRNKYRVISAARYDLYYHPKAEGGEFFQWHHPEQGFVGVVRVGQYDYGCECCGSYTTLFHRDGSECKVH
jgi:hypothetical protein